MTRMKKGKLGEKKMVFGSGSLDDSRRRFWDWMGKGNAEFAEDAKDQGGASCLIRCVGAWCVFDGCWAWGSRVARVGTVLRRVCQDSGVDPDHPISGHDV